jgi:hypothetical protein
MIVAIRFNLKFNHANPISSGCGVKNRHPTDDVRGLPGYCWMVTHFSPMTFADVLNVRVISWKNEHLS